MMLSKPAIEWEDAMRIGGAYLRELLNPVAPCISPPRRSNRKEQERAMAGYAIQVSDWKATVREWFAEARRVRTRGY